MNKYKVGTIVRLKGHEGEYEIIASSSDRRNNLSGLSMPFNNADYTFKRIDGNMEASFEPYQHLDENMIIEK